MTDTAARQTPEFRAAVRALVDALPVDFAGRVVVHVKERGGVKVEVSEFTTLPGVGVRVRTEGGRG